MLAQPRVSVLVEVGAIEVDKPVWIAREVRRHPVEDDPDAFLSLHFGCGRLEGDAEPVTADGRRVWIACSGGARFDRWVTADVAERELLPEN
jgi:hypothetical protein